MVELVFLALFQNDLLVSVSPYPSFACTILVLFVAASTQPLLYLSVVDVGTSSAPHLLVVEYVTLCSVFFLSFLVNIFFPSASLFLHERL